MVEHIKAEPARACLAVTSEQAEQHVGAARKLFQRVLGAWASDCFELRRRGMIEPSEASAQELDQAA